MITALFTMQLKVDVRLFNIGEGGPTTSNSLWGPSNTNPTLLVRNTSELPHNDVELYYDNQDLTCSVEF